MKPLITIAMPVYNVERYIERALYSALDQEYENIEILVVDDKGKDNSIEIVRDIIKTHPRGKIVRILDHGVNQGTGATKNTAIANAKGEYLLFMDSDDYISKDCVKILYTSIADNDADMAIGNFSQFSINGDYVYNHICGNHIYNGVDAYTDFYNSKEYYVQTWNKLYRLKVLRDNNVHCIPSNTNEDVFFSFQLFQCIRKIVTVSSITYFYAVGDPNATTYNMRRSYIDLKRVNQYIGILSSMAEILKENPNVAMQKYFLKYKYALIRDIVRSKNTNNSEKKTYLNMIPSFNSANCDEAQKELPFSITKYLDYNPILVQCIDNILHLPINLLRSAKHKILR